MTNNMKKFLDAASKDADLMKKLDAIQEPGLLHSPSRDLPVISQFLI